MLPPNTSPKTRGVLFYTDSCIGEPIGSIVQKQILKSGLPITSVSHKPLDFGNNIVLPLVRSYPSIVKQIITGLKASNEDYVFFTEHDVLYHKSHFDFEPKRDDIFYYNANVWRWDYPKDRAFTYSRLLQLSALCVNREFALDHYQKRLAKIKGVGWDMVVKGEPEWVRKMGYEPGTKKKKRGGFSNDDFETWWSEYPNIDIRHKDTFSPPKLTLDEFKHKPINWQEMKVTQVPGWDIKTLFNL